MDDDDENENRSKKIKLQEEKLPWESDRMTIQRSSSVAEPTSVVQVSFKGWFSFSFGTRNAPYLTMQKSSSSMNDERTTGSCADNDGSLRLLIYSSTAEPCARHEPIQTYNLPLRHKGLPLCTTRIGMLVYLPKGSIVSVQASQDSISSPLQSESQWKLQFVRTSLSRQTTTPTPGSLALHHDESKNQHHKPLVCTFCRRIFPSIKAVQRHASNAHSSDSSNPHRMCEDPMWQRPLKIVFQDDYLAVVVKPQGMTVQGGKMTLQRSDLLLPLAATRCGSGSKSRPSDDTIDDRSLTKPRAVHRLDAGTGGLLVVAKTVQAESKLRESFRDRSCHKRYRALVWGKLIVEDGPSGASACELETISSISKSPVGRCERDISGKPSVSLYQVVRHVRRRQDKDASEASPRGSWMTVVDLWPETGRRHQLRRHLQSLGHPIVGDTRYGGGVNDTAVAATRKSTTHTTSELHNDNRNSFSRLCLWAMEIRLPHPLIQGQTVNCVMEDPEWLDFVIRHEEISEEMSEATE